MLIKEKRVLVHKLLWKLGATKSKTAFLEEYGVTSTTELNDEEIDHLIQRLQNSVDNRYNSSKELRYWRSCALSLLNKCGVYVTNNDWDRVNNFMLDSRICGKLLYELTVDELKALCSKLRSIASKKESHDKQVLINGISLN
jgi:hypothetical protein